MTAMAADLTTAPDAVPGLLYVPDYLGRAAQEELLGAVDAGPWSAEMSRRVQHYGFRYDSKKRALTESDAVGPLPDWAERLAARLFGDGFFAGTPDQPVVNEYEPGQGIAPHVDCVPCFGPVVASLSLGSGCDMTFDRPGTSDKHMINLAPGGLVVMRGDARYVWRHGIPGRKNDRIGGVASPRGRRISLTFRTALPG